MEQLAQQVLNWLALGAVYSLVAIGFSLLFGVLNVIHFSHGDVALVAPFVAMATVLLVPASGLAFALLLAVVLVGALGIALERVPIRRFRTTPPMMALVATVALGIVIRELIRLVYPNGSNPHAFPRLIEGDAMTIAGASVSWLVVALLATSALLVAALSVFLRATKTGMRIRAVSQDLEMARLLGIDPNRVYRTTFFVASATGAAGGIFFASYIGLMRFDLGIMIGLLAFSAAVIGGLGSMAGAIAGSMLLAALETLAQAVLPDGAKYRLVVAFVLVLVVLVFRPAGLFGRPSIEKV
ncbi:MAG: branched-chain amino acid ABC transporter permease [Burkholderiales bacterium]|nr:branched-chain amino acid ABC transporter permease [Burkholderiales bacterium]